MKKVIFTLFVLFFVFSSFFSQVDRKKDYYDTPSMWFAFNHVYYEVKNENLDTLNLRSMISQINFEKIFEENQKPYEDTDVFIPQVDKTLVIYSSQKAFLLFREKYKVN